MSKFNTPTHSPTSNRAAAYTKLTELGLALTDVDQCLKLDANFIKGWLRKGNILLAMKKASEARKAFEKVGLWRGVGCPPLPNNPPPPQPGPGA